MEFLKALNPIETRSGIMYRLNEKQMEINPELHDTEMTDATVVDILKLAPEMHARGTFLDYSKLVSYTYNVIMGSHYDANLLGVGSKGLLDFLIFPLLARKLMADTKLEEREESHLVNILALCVAGALEFVRTLMGATLTAVLAITVLPVVFAVEHIVNYFAPESINVEVEQNDDAKSHVSDELPVDGGNNGEEEDDDCETGTSFSGSDLT